jgi:hypothetical protein
VTDSAETRTDQLTQETADVAVNMINGRRVYARMKYFLNLAFPTKPGIPNEFGLNDYDSIGSNVAAMVKFLANMHDKAENKYKTQLLAVGVTQAHIDEILTVKNSLSTEETEQEVFKATGPEATAARIATHNTTWGFVQRVNNASKAVYYDDFVKLNLFLLPRNNEPDTTIFNLLGTASDAGTASPLPGVGVRIIELGLTTTTDANGQYAYTNIPPGSYTLEFTLAGYVTETAAVVVADDGTQNVVDVQLAAA